jgi:hypothetical protein
MLVRIDEARHYDHARDVDHFSVLNGEVHTDGNYPSPLDEDVSARVVTDLRIKAKNNTTF